MKEKKNIPLTRLLANLLVFATALEYCKSNHIIDPILLGNILRVESNPNLFSYDQIRDSSLSYIGRSFSNVISTWRRFSELSRDKSIYKANTHQNARKAYKSITCTRRTSKAGLFSGSSAMSSNLLCMSTSSALSTFTSDAYLHAPKFSTKKTSKLKLSR